MVPAFIYFCNKSSGATTGMQNRKFFLPITHYSSVDRAVKSICGEMAAMRCFHVPGVFGLKPDLRIAGVALVITYFFTALIG